MEALEVHGTKQYEKVEQFYQTTRIFKHRITS